MIKIEDPIETGGGAPSQSVPLYSAVIYVNGRRVAGVMTGAQLIEARNLASQYPFAAPDLRPWWKRIF